MTDDKTSDRATDKTTDRARTPWAAEWTLDPDIYHLNHGSFGACPREVLSYQTALRAQLERQPCDFLLLECEGLLHTARERLGSFVGADQRDLAFVHNATSGVNTVLRSLRFEPGEQLLTTDHQYNACKRALEFVANRAGSEVVAVPIPLPTSGADEVFDRVLGAVTDRTKLVLLDHVSSDTGLVMPLARLVSALAERGIDSLVDGAHAPGMIPVNLSELNAAYYTGNCHKWICAPKGAAFLHVRRDRQAGLAPLTVSHGGTVESADGFRAAFDWNGTDDPTGYLSVPKALTVVGDMIDGGWQQVRARNHTVAVEARRKLLGALGTEPLAPEAMLGSLAAVRLPQGAADLSGLQCRLRRDYQIEVPVHRWRGMPNQSLLRISSQLYNAPSDYDYLIEALLELL